MAEHKRCMTELLHPCSLTEDVLNLMTSGNKEREDSGVRYSPSSLLGCYRQAILSRNRDWYVDVEKSWSQVRGNMVHALMEDQPAWDGVLGTVRELRMRHDIETSYGMQVFMGKADLIVLKSIALINEDGLGLPARRVLHVRLVDYKTVGEVGHRDTVDEKHERQINMYAWLIRETLAAELNVVNYDEWGDIDPDGEYQLSLASGVRVGDLHDIDEVVVDELEIFYADFKKTRRFTSAGSLTAKGKRLPDHVTYEQLDLKPIRKMNHKATQRWIANHIEQAIDAETELPAPLAYEDRAFSGDAYVCYFCPVRVACIEVGIAEGYDVAGQGGTNEQSSVG